MTKACPDCHPYPAKHLQNWIDHSAALIGIRGFGGRRVQRRINDFLLGVRIFSLEKDFALADVNPLSALYIEAARKRGAEILAFKGPRGYSGKFRMGGIDFDVLPIAEAGRNSLSARADDKFFVKRELQKLGVPTMPGRAFWWGDGRKAAKLAREIGYPVIVKPRAGSLSQHIYRAEDEAGLRRAIKRVGRYSPAYLVEKFLPDAVLHRITVAGGKVFAARRLAPAVAGDGVRTLRELAREAGFSEGNMDAAILREQGRSLEAVVPRGAAVRLHYKIVMALGAEVEEVPEGEIHEATRKMCVRIAEHFGLGLVGVDVLAEDLGRPLSGQRAAVLELNTLPNIRMHTIEEGGGGKRNAVAEALAEMGRTE